MFSNMVGRNQENNREATEEAPPLSHSCATLPNIIISFLLIAHIVSRHPSSFPNIVMPLHNAFIRIDWLKYASNKKKDKTKLTYTQIIVPRSLRKKTKKKQTNSHSWDNNNLIDVFMHFRIWCVRNINWRKRNRFNLYVCSAQWNGVACTAHHNSIVNTFGSLSSVKIKGPWICWKTIRAQHLLNWFRIVMLWAASRCNEFSDGLQISLVFRASKLPNAFDAFLYLWNILFVIIARETQLLSAQHYSLEMFCYFRYFRYIRLFFSSRYIALTWIYFFASIPFALKTLWLLTIRHNSLFCFVLFHFSFYLNEICWRLHFFPVVYASSQHTSYQFHCIFTFQHWWLILLPTN